MTDMQTIQQEGVTTTRNVSLAPRNRDFFDEFDSGGFSSRSRCVQVAMIEWRKFDLVFSYDAGGSRSSDRYDEDSKK